MQRSDLRFVELENVAVSTLNFSCFCFLIKRSVSFRLRHSILPQTIPKDNKQPACHAIPNRGSDAGPFGAHA
jgi:hypothetical protein